MVSLTLENVSLTSACDTERPAEYVVNLPRLRVKMRQTRFDYRHSKPSGKGRNHFAVVFSDGHPTSRIAIHEFDTYFVNDAAQTLNPRPLA